MHVVLGKKGRKGDEDYFSLKLCVRIKDNNNSPHGKFHRFLFSFSSKFSDLNFAKMFSISTHVMPRVTHNGKYFFTAIIIHRMAFGTKTKIKHTYG